jgi:hypothetical protein
MRKTLRLLSPVGESRVTALQAPALPPLRGKTVGFIDNRKTNFDRLIEGLSAILRDRHGVGRIVHRQKAHAAVGAPPELLAEMARTCDLVITGSGD